MSKIDDSRLKCSFCGKTQDQVKKLIAGPEVYICDECVDLCNEILDEEFFEPKDKKVKAKEKESFDDNSKNVSDINNSSPVETSPVFSSDEVLEVESTEIKATLEEIKVNIEDVVATLPVVSENITFAFVMFTASVGTIILDATPFDIAIKASNFFNSKTDSSALTDFNAFKPAASASFEFTISQGQ